MHTMVQWLHALLLQHSFSTPSTAILDVGTGNALLPLELAKLGYTDLTGSDYSPKSIALARQLTSRHNQRHIRLLVWERLGMWHVVRPAGLANAKTFIPAGR